MRSDFLDLMIRKTLRQEQVQAAGKIVKERTPVTPRNSIHIISGPNRFLKISRRNNNDEIIVFLYQPTRIPESISDSNAELRSSLVSAHVYFRSTRASEPAPNFVHFPSTTYCSSYFPALTGMVKALKGLRLDVMHPDNIASKISSAVKTNPLLKFT